MFQIETYSEKKRWHFYEFCKHDDALHRYFAYFVSFISYWIISKVDVLADESVRQGIKDFSQWPTIPQLYVCGEFIGGSDIMIEMYQSGELGEMIEKAKADMI